MGTSLKTAETGLNRYSKKKFKFLTNQKISNFQVKIG